VYSETQSLFCSFGSSFFLYQVGVLRKTLQCLEYGDFSVFYFLAGVSGFAFMLFEKMNGMLRVFYPSDF